MHSRVQHLPPKEHFMRDRLPNVAAFVLACLLGSPALADLPDRSERERSPVQLGPRPFFLVEDMSDGPLKRRLQACSARTTVYRSSDFSIGHRGAALQFPEHTRESYEAAVRMGAGTSSAT
jgi:glycerophosphoryl diester phosphodiesterase